MFERNKQTLRKEKARKRKRKKLLSFKDASFYRASSEA